MQAAPIDIASGLSALDSYSEDLKALYESQDMEKTEYDAARFAALERKFAFSIAIMQQGENGVVSNQDYNNALKQIRGSKVPEVYAATLRTLVADDLPKVNMAYQTVQNDIGIRTAIKMLDEAGMDSSLYSRFTISLDERFAVLGEDRGKAVQAWLYEKPTATPPKVEPQVGTSGTYVHPPQAMADEEAMYQQFLKDFKTPVNATPAQLNAMADRLEREQRDKQ